MTAKISYAKTVKILHHYFSGLPQLKIATKCGVNQGSVSHYIAKFQEEAVSEGLEEAAKEYGIMEEVKELRSLAVDLYKSKISVEEAKSGLKMVNLFKSLGVFPEEQEALAKAFIKVKDPGFAKAAVELIKLEESTGKSYANIVSEYQQLGQEIATRQEIIASLKTKQENEEKLLHELQATNQTEDQELDKKKGKLTAEVDRLIKSEVQLKTEVGHLKESKKALDDSIDTLKIQKTQLEQLLAVLEKETAALETKKTALAGELSSKEQQVAEIDKKLKGVDALDKELKEKGEKLKEWDAKIAVSGQKYKMFEAFLGLVSERSVAEIEEFLKSAPALINNAKTGKYNPGLLVNFILSKLSGNTLDHLICQSCKAEFVMLKRGHKAMAIAHLPGGIPNCCPDCSWGVKVIVKTPLAETFKKVIVSSEITMVKGQDKTAPDEKDKPESQVD